MYMADAPGIAGSARPELEAVFLDHVESVKFFTGMSRQPCDVWEVDVAGLWIEMHDNWLIHRSPIPPERLRLIVQDLPPRYRGRINPTQDDSGIEVTPVEKSSCPSCDRTFRYQKMHSGFNNTGFAYCDTDGALLVWDTYDPQYTAIAGFRHPWTLNQRDQERVESALKPCPCGGSLGMRNPPRCPHCANGIQDLCPDPIFYVDVGRRLDSTKNRLWTTTEEY